MPRQDGRNQVPGLLWASFPKHVFLLLCSSNICFSLLYVLLCTRLRAEVPGSNRPTDIPATVTGLGNRGARNLATLLYSVGTGWAEGRLLPNGHTQKPSRKLKIPSQCTVFMEKKLRTLLFQEKSATYSFVILQLSLFGAQVVHVSAPPFAPVRVPSAQGQKKGDVLESLSHHSGGN